MPVPPQHPASHLHAPAPRHSIDTVYVPDRLEPNDLGARMGHVYNDHVSRSGPNSVDNTRHIVDHHPDKRTMVFGERISSRAKRMQGHIN